MTSGPRPASPRSVSPRLAVVGAGAIGSRLAAHLAAAGVRATLFDGWAEHVEAINRRGLTLRRAGTETTHRLQARHASAPGGERFDIVLLAVRGDATVAALPLVAGLLRDDGCVVSCQNGINEEAIAAAVGSGRTLGCSMIFGARLVAPGLVEALPGEDTLCVGEMTGPAGARVRRLQALFAHCGHASRTDDLMAYRWKKLALNCMGNPLTLLSGLTAGELHADAGAREAIIAIAAEVLATGRAAGIDAEPVLGHPAGSWLRPDARDDPALHAALRAHGDALGQRRFSMWADFAARGRTEVDVLNGFVVAKAAALGRAAPMNAAVVDAVHRLERGETAAGAEALAAVLRELPPRPDADVATLR